MIELEDLILTDWISRSHCVSKTWRRPMTGRRPFQAWGMSQSFSCSSCYLTPGNMDQVTLLTPFLLLHNQLELQLRWCEAALHVRR